MIPFKICFIYLFRTVLGLCFCVQTFSSCEEPGPLSSCVVRAFHCSGFSCGARALGHAGFGRHDWATELNWTELHVGSVVVACRPQSTGSIVVAHRPICPIAHGVLLDQGLNRCPLHCETDFSTTGLPRKPCIMVSYSHKLNFLSLYRNLTQSQLRGRDLCTQVIKVTLMSLIIN